MKSTVSCVIRLNTHPVCSAFNHYVALEAWIISIKWAFFSSVQQCFNSHSQDTVELMWLSLELSRPLLCAVIICPVTIIPVGSWGGKEENQPIVSYSFTLVGFLTFKLCYYVQMQVVHRPLEGQMLNVQKSSSPSCKRREILTLNNK